MADRKCGIEVYPVRTFEFQQKIEAICKDRKDSWAADVFAKLEYAQDLPAADAIYHQKCSVNFRTGKNIPIGTPDQKRKKQGTPDHTEANTAFLRTMDYFQENEEDQLTVKYLVHQMTQFCGDLAYTTVHMKSKIKTHFGDEAFITDVCGKPNVVTLRKTASALLQEFHQSKKTCDPETEKKRYYQNSSKTH
ncbi:unnamed protein product [Mytilus coruscus]|uniref:Uncharacterized protein n=1 Tax=Mytilus coruscus TaxID=42192 RepID=A0A6J8CC21_MYTCO|nr:unnamed protein product [Mytilus coruscus]